MNDYETAKEHGIDTIVKIEAENNNVPLKDAMQTFARNLQEYGITTGTLRTLEEIRQYKPEVETCLIGVKTT